MKSGCTDHTSPNSVMAAEFAPDYDVAVLLWVSRDSRATE